MLVVIAIIALLAALIVPAVSKSLDRASRVGCLNNLRQISIATMAWASEHKEQLPVAMDAIPYPHRFPNYDDIFGDLLPNRDSVMFCPGKLRQVRNAETSDYDTVFITYQYFRSDRPFKGSYQNNKPNMTYVSTYPAEAAIWGCLTVSKSNGVVLAHNEPEVSKPVSGMNAVYLDGHGKWVNSENLEVYYHFYGLDFYWPVPGK